MGTRTGHSAVPARTNLSGTNNAWGDACQISMSPPHSELHLNPYSFKFVFPTTYQEAISREKPRRSPNENWVWSSYQNDYIARNENMLCSIVESQLMVRTETNLGCLQNAIHPEIIQQLDHGNVLSPLPYLQKSISADPDISREPCTVAEEIKKKSYSFADKLNINTKNLFANNPENWLSNARFHRFSLCDHFPYYGNNCTYVRGIHGETLETTLVFVHTYWKKGFILPYRTIVNNYGIVFSLFLPGKEHLIGLNQMPIQNAVYLTPNFMEQTLNPGSISWVGDFDTVKANVVDFSPLYNRSIVYTINPAFFSGNTKQCLACMETVCEKLSANGCRVNNRAQRTRHCLKPPIGGRNADTPRASATVPAFLS